MLEKILRAVRNMLKESQINAIERQEAAAVLHGITLGNADVGDITIECLAPDGIFLEWSIDLSTSTTFTGFSGPTITPATGTETLVANRYIGAEATDFMKVLIDPTITDDGTEYTSVTYGSKARVGEAPKGSIFFLPFGTVTLFRLTSHAADNNIVVRLNAQKA